MSKRDSPILPGVGVVSRGHAKAERVVSHPSGADFSLEDLSTEVHHDASIEEPAASDSRGGYAATGAVEGAWLGWLLGLCVGVGFLTLPGLGLVFAKGSVLATFLMGIGGGMAGALIGVVVGALVGWTPRQRDMWRL